jgi:hypothetical protein
MEFMSLEDLAPEDLEDFDVEELKEIEADLEEALRGLQPSHLLSHVRKLLSATTSP